MEPTTWAAFAMALLSLVGTIATSINARKVAKDKLDHEAQMKALELDAKRKDEDLAEMRAALAKCREQHEASERDRDHLRERIAHLERQMAKA
jgi:heme exporter protein D